MRSCCETRKIFGIGLNKTGTTTLGTCFRELEFRHLSARRDLLDAYSEGRLNVIFDEIDKYDSFEDWPFPLMYRELFEHYGDTAWFILTTRFSPEVWLNSLKAHSLSTPPTEHCRLIAYGYNYPHGFEKEHITFYETHNAGVKTFFEAHGASDKLLRVCWETGDGWPELCGFLGVKTLQKPFPHSNKMKTPDPEFAAENQRLIDRQIRVPPIFV